MQLAILSDVHGNLEALRAVLLDLGRRAPGAQLVAAGDLVGYGPDPEACIDILATRGALVVRGNHEEMVLGTRDFSRCVRAGIVAAVWTREHLSSSARALLEGLPAWIEPTPGVVVCHGDLDSADHYVSSAERARQALGRLAEVAPHARVLVCGHTHEPVFASVAAGFAAQAPSTQRRLSDAESCLVNPGAVGQERRRGYPLARFALLDTERRTVEYCAVSYDHERTARKARRFGLRSPVMLLPPLGLARRVVDMQARRARRWAARRGGFDETHGALPGPGVTFPSPSVPTRVLLHVGNGLRVSGAAAGFARLRPRQGATILVYHGVSDQHSACWLDPRFSTPVASFTRQMQFLSRYRKVLSLSKLLDIIAHGESPPSGSVAITFDDGYRSILDVAAPILERHGFPATVYLATAFVSRGEMQWIDALYSAFCHRTRHLLDLREDGLRMLSLRDPETVREAYETIGKCLVSASVERRGEIIQEIIGQLRPAGAPPRLTLTWEEAAKLRTFRPGFEIGAHTRHHVDLTACDPSTAAQEILGSIEDVRRELSVEPAHFSFPYGRSSEAYRLIVAHANMRSAAVTNPPDLVRAGADPFRLPRTPAPDDVSTLSYVTSGAYPDLPRALFGRP